MILSRSVHAPTSNNVYFEGTKEQITKFLTVNVLREEESFILTDPGGEVFTLTYDILFEKGYDIRLVDLLYFESWDSFNPFYYAKRFPGKTSEILQAVVDSIMLTQPTLQNEKRTLLTSLLRYLCDTREIFTFQDVAELFVSEDFLESKLDNGIVNDLLGFLGLYLADFVSDFTTTDSLRLDSSEKQAIYLLTWDSGFPVAEVTLSLIYQVAHILHGGSIRYYQSGDSVFLTDKDLFRSKSEHYTIFSEDEAVRDLYCNTSVGVYPYRGNSCIVKRNGQIFIDSYIP